MALDVPPRVGTQFRGQIYIAEQALGIGPHLRRCLGQQAGETMLDDGRGVAIGEHRHARRHRFEHRHVEAVFEARVGGMHEESVRCQQTFEIVPVGRRLHVRHVGIVTDDSHRKAGQRLLVKVPGQEDPLGRDVIGHAQSARHIARAREVGIGIGAVVYHHVRHAPRLRLRSRDRDGVAADGRQIRIEHGAHVARIELGVLLRHAPLKHFMQHQQLGRIHELRIQQIGDIVIDDAVVVCAGRAHLFECERARAGRKGAHAGVPALGVSTGETYHDVELGAEDTELVDPGFVAVEDEEFHAG